MAEPTGSTGQAGPTAGSEEPSTFTIALTGHRPTKLAGYDMGHPFYGIELDPAQCSAVLRFTNYDATVDSTALLELLGLATSEPSRDYGPVAVQVDPDDGEVEIIASALGPESGIGLPKGTSTVFTDLLSPAIALEPMESLSAGRRYLV